MKIPIALLALLGCFTTYSQNLEIPQNEFNVSLSESSITLRPGESRKLDVYILKSKRYKKNLMKMGSSPPDGIIISFSPEKGDAEVSEATIAANENASAGQYAVIINSTLNYKTKGAVLKILIE